MELDAELSGLDALELVARRRRSRAGPGSWAATWPKLLAIAIVLVVLADRRLERLEAGDHVLPPPGEVFRTLWDEPRRRHRDASLARRCRPGFRGFAIALVIGTVARCGRRPRTGSCAPPSAR